MFSWCWHFLYKSLFLLIIFLYPAAIFILSGASFWGNFPHFGVGFAIALHLD
jgi:hypothetical protein